MTAIAALSLLPQPVAAQAKKDSVVMAMALEPPGLDPTSGAAAAIAEVTLYNVYETLTKVKEDGTAAPLLAESWTTSPDVKTYTFKLRKGVKFQNGEPLNAETVKFSFERSAAPTSTNKDKSLFQSIAADHDAGRRYRRDQDEEPGAEPAVPARAGARLDRRAEERGHQRHQPGWAPARIRWPPGPRVRRSR